MKKLVSIIAFIAIAASFSSAQWKFDKNFPDDNFTDKMVHGIVVDKDNKVWIQPYYATDSIFNDGVKTAVHAIYVYNPDGTPASFSPLRRIVGNGIYDSMAQAGVGLCKDQDGNILVAVREFVYRVNYKTGAGMAKVAAYSALANMAPACDADGNIYTATVLPGNPIKEWLSDFSFVGNALDTLAAYGRTLTVSPDGLTLYAPRYDIVGTFKLTRPDKFSAFSITDTVFKGLAIESCCWHPTTGDLWVSAGSYFNKPTDTAANTIGTWYGFNMTTGKKTDSLKWQFFKAGNADERPRAIGFSPDGKTAYVGVFGANGWPECKKYVKGADDVKKEGDVVLSSYELSQNYPNPFNPSTSIRFSVPKNGFVTLKVYSILGQEVATLVNQELTAGAYSTNFDGSKIASGTYIYEMRANGVTVSKKMLLMK